MPEYQPVDTLIPVSTDAANDDDAAPAPPTVEELQAEVTVLQSTLAKAIERRAAFVAQWGESAEEEQDAIDYQATIRMELHDVLMQIEHIQMKAARDAEAARLALEREMNQPEPVEPPAPTVNFVPLKLIEVRKGLDTYPLVDTLDEYNAIMAKRDAHFEMDTRRAQLMTIITRALLLLFVFVLAFSFVRSRMTHEADVPTDVVGAESVAEPRWLPLQCSSVAVT